MLVVIYSKILHHRFIPTIYQFLNQFFYLSSANENLEICVSVWFAQLKEQKKF